MKKFVPVWAIALLAGLFALALSSADALAMGGKPQKEIKVEDKATSDSQEEATSDSDSGYSDEGTSEYSDDEMGSDEQSEDEGMDEGGSEDSE